MSASSHEPVLSHTALHRVLSEHYDLEELRTLCFEIGVDYANLPGEGKSAKARELVVYCQRHQLVNKLVTAMREDGMLPLVASPTLPAPSQHFVGREAELNQIALKIESAHAASLVVAIHGMGGVGKTALAQGLARRVAGSFPGGVLWLNLGPKMDAFTVLDRCAAFAGADVSVYLELDSRAAAVCTALAGRGRLLAVLDDVWDYDSTDWLLHEVLPSDRTVLITSRDADVVKALRCDAVRLDVLQEDDAVKLLASFLGELGPYEQAARQVANLIECLPLALELAAGQCDAPADLPDLARKLQGKPTLNVLKMPVGEKRETSVEACLSPSYNALDADMQRHFRALGVFAPAPFDLAAVQSVWAEDDQDVVIEALKRLVRRGLLTREAGTQVYRQHVLLRAYALALLEQVDELIQISARYVEHYRKLAQSSDWRIPEAAFDHVAHGWKSAQDGDADTVIGYLYAVQWFLYRRGRLLERIEWSNIALERARQAHDPRAEGTLLNDIGFVQRRLGRWDEALDSFQHSLAIRREIGDSSGEVVTLNNIGKIHQYRGLLDAAIDYFQQGLTLAQRIGDGAGEAYALINIGHILQRRDQSDDAMSCFQRALEVYRRAGDRLGEALALNDIGEVYHDKGQLDVAFDHYQQSLAIRREYGHLAGEAHSLKNIGRIYRDRNQMDLALSHFQQSLEIRHEIGDRANEATMLYETALLLEQQGETQQAIPMMERCLAIEEQIGHPNTANVRAQLEEMQKKAQP